jgi:hypothetical protein
MSRGKRVRSASEAWRVRLRNSLTSLSHPLAECVPLHESTLPLDDHAPSVQEAGAETWNPLPSQPISDLSAALKELQRVENGAHSMQRAVSMFELPTAYPTAAAKLACWTCMQAAAPLFNGVH